MRNKLFANFILLLFVVLFSFGFLQAIQPSGASNLTQISNGTTPTVPAGSAAAIAGNVTEMDIYGYSPTQSWQGYYGNVTGTITLSNSLGNVLYNWTDTSPTGEVYSSTNDSVDWTNIQCFNYTAKGTYANDDANRGGTSQFGMNLTQLENNFNIPLDAVDSINNTFNLTGAGNHATFYTNNLQFSDGQCQSTRLYINSGQTAPNTFEEVLLYDPDTRSPIWTSLLNSDVLGFDGKTHDFEMMVPEDGHAADTSTTTYYFYVELQ